MKYFDKLRAANNTTKSLGLDGVDLKDPIESGFLNDSFFGQLGNFIKIDQPEELVLKCNVVSQIIVEEINKNMNCRAYLTIGDVTLGGVSQFDYDVTYLIALANGEQGSLIPSEYKHHAWITLESMEIIDFTVATSIALIGENLPREVRSKMMGGVTAGHADSLRNGLEYHPFLVGDNFYTTYDKYYTSIKNSYRKALDLKPDHTRTRFTSISPSK